MKKVLLAACIAFMPAFIHAQDNVPDISLKTVSGESINLRTLADTATVPIVISFWATWCAPCMKELDNINEVYEEWQNETGVRLYAVSIDDSRSKNRVPAVVSGKGWDYTVLYDDNQDLKRAFNIVNPPHAILIYKGKVIFQHNGYKPGDEDDLYEKIKSLHS